MLPFYFGDLFANGMAITSEMEEYAKKELDYMNKVARKRI